MAAATEIDVWQGEIAELEVDAIVIAASESLFMTSGAAASVKRHGGDVIEQAAIDQGPISPGSAVVTGGGRLAVPYIIHAVAVGHDRIADAATLEAAVHAAIAFAEPLRLRRIAIAPLGVETGAFTPEEAAALLVPALRREAAATGLESVVLATAHEPEARALRDALRAADAGASVT
jgi:O-acetyl-ADP-ribose deacetylase (regulator of RNase III)